MMNMKRRITLTQSQFKALVAEEMNRAASPNIISDENGDPMVFYHSYDIHNYDSSLIYLSTDEEFTKEFGGDTEAFYICSERTYVTEDDEYLRDKDGNVIMYEGEPATIGYLDSIDEEYLDWFRENYDCMMDREGMFTVVFDKSSLIPIERHPNSI